MRAFFLQEMYTFCTLRTTMKYSHHMIYSKTYSTFHPPPQLKTRYSYKQWLFHPRASAVPPGTVTSKSFISLVTITWQPSRDLTHTHTQPCST